MIATRKRDTDVAVGAFPADLAGAEVRGPALAMDASLIVVVADRLQARVQGSFFILEVRLLPSGLADDVALAVANVPGGVLQVLRLAGVVVDVQGGEPVGGGGMASQERDDQGQNHS